MNEGKIAVRVCGQRSRGLWSLVSLEFGLAAQAAGREEALAKLRAQIEDYVYDATRGEDAAWRDRLLGRKAPAEFFVKYLFAAASGRLAALAGMHACVVSISVPAPEPARAA